MRNLILTLVLAASPMIASADSPKWFPKPDESTTAGTEVGALRSGQVAYHENDDATTDSNVLDTNACSPAIFTLNPDEDGTATGAEVNLWALDDCSGSTANNGNKIQPDTDGDGLPNNVTFNGSTAKRTSISFYARCIQVEASANPNTDEYRVMVECK